MIHIDQFSTFVLFTLYFIVPPGYFIVNTEIVSIRGSSLFKHWGWDKHGYNLHIMEYICYSRENLKSGIEIRTRPDLILRNWKFEIRTCPELKSGHVQIWNFAIEKLKSGRVRIWIPDASGFEISQLKNWNPDVSEIEIRTCPDLKFFIDK